MGKCWERTEITSYLFDPLDSVLIQKGIGTDDRDVQRKSLRHQETIKGIAMVKRQKSR